MKDHTKHAWDFSHVLDLVNSLGPAPPISKENGTVRSYANSHTIRTENKEVDESSSGLGNFSKIWEYLGAPKDAPAPIVPTGEAADFFQLPGREDYASDGAIYRATAKEVKWKDRIDDQDISQTLEESEGTKSPNTTNKQEKNRRKKQRRKERAEAQCRTKSKATSDLDSEVERRAAKGAPAKKASKHVLSAPQTLLPAPRCNLRSNTPKKNTTHAPKSAGQGLEPVAAAVQSQPQVPKTPPAPVPSTNGKNGYRVTEEDDIPSSVLIFDQLPTQGHASGRKAAAEALNQQLQKNWNPSAYAPVAALNPASVTPSAPLQSFSSTIAQPSLPPISYPLVTTSTRRHAIQPLSLRTGEDRYWALMLKLIADFPADRRTLVSPSLLINHNSDPAGVHVFVDASNIFIGFHDQLKRARGIPVNARVPRVDLSFASLALLLERRRPVAKRVLAGSTPSVPAFAEAAQIGYELNVLDKVHKAKELTPRQKFFEAATNKTPTPKPGHRQRTNNSHNHQRTTSDEPATTDYYYSSDNNNNNNHNGSTTNTSAPLASVSATPVPVPGAKWHEQAVDEILHLKILESVVDCSSHPTTIVLATGDAAEAEFSEGFRRMAERALQKGWSVELCSWSRNISAAYRRREWVEQWGERFRVIELDEYAEELLEM
ncbi:MAG: hypothetical protein M1822_004768 [Bathelium mastoideum]|nr:MAG: hypothetical protein M1822_004768 [Bathelium mastoideum]